uniref:Uncharacterized protein n=1 Tax=Anguilla anguilla TaxID=7936 RepID=A0A0E9RR72_ANGAN
MYLRAEHVKYFYILISMENVNLQLANSAENGLTTLLFMT